VLPTQEIVMEAKDDYQFDYFQMSLLSFATPLSVLAQSKDGRWLFVETPYVSGWVRSQDIAIAKSKEEILRYLNFNMQEKTLLTVTGPRVGLYADSRLQTYAGRLRLGTRIPTTKKSGDVFEVLVPSRNFSGALTFKRGYISRRASVTPGFPLYTQENIIKIAFSMLGEPYGWGGMFGFWDCSAYTRDVFSVYGFVLPRNSTSQSKIGVVIGVFDKETPIEEKYEALKDAPPGITLLRLPGHVMIYLGEIDGKHYAIHDTWGFRTKSFLGRSQLNNIGRIVVSELSLGEGGKKGSLIERITHVIVIKAGDNTK
jgi:SH3 domain containing protein/NlpC/P60 family protein